jgi:NADH:ubiquinone oxidoreductase subunit 5 (subunit L)/multisubunit Na+/H+ antiporter MnhA subunit
MTASLHPASPHDLPAFIADPGQSDVLMTVVAVILVLAVLAFGLLFFRLHTLPERMAHKSQKIQFEIVAVLGLLALFTHIHAFWVAGLLLALIDLPEIGWPLRRMARSLERIAGITPGEGAVEASDKASSSSAATETSAGTAPAEPAPEVPKTIAPSRMPPKERFHA